MTSLENWNAKRIDRYADALDRGEHDQQCEQQERSSLCHCRKRARLAKGLTEAPELWYTAPCCSGCLNECSHDGDTWVCDYCHVTFDGFDERGKFNDDHGDDIGGEQYGRRLIEIVDQPTRHHTLADTLAAEDRVRAEDGHLGGRA